MLTKGAGNGKRPGLPQREAIEASRRREVKIFTKQEAKAANSRMHSPDVPVKHRSEVRRRADAGVSRASGELEAGGEEEGQGSSTAAAARPEVAGLAGGKVLAGDGKCNGCDEAGLREQAGWGLPFASSTLAPRSS